MSMMCPPQSVKIVSTPSFFSALATRCPPEMTLASRLFRLSVSSAVVVPLLSVVLVAVSSMDASRDGSRAQALFRHAAGRAPFLQASARRQLRRRINGRGPIRVGAAQGLQDQN